ITLSSISKDWSYLDNFWSLKFLKEAENLESNKINFDDLKEKKDAFCLRGELLGLYAWYPFQSFNSDALTLLLVNTERSQHKKFLQTFWTGVIKECEKENQPATEPKNKGKKQRLTELEFLSAIPPSIYYPDLDKRTTTIKSLLKF
ncbi:8017_t:CDS:2, partial [Funneliformis geosporum]